MVETPEQLKIGGLRMIQPQHGYRFSLDAVLLADFITLKPAERLLDLGAGAGIIPLLLAALTPAREIVGVELQPELAALAQRNVALNRLDARIRIVPGDLRQVERLFRAGEFDVVCANPPYRKVGAGRLNPNAQQALARHEIACRLSDVVAACQYVVKPGGKVFLIYLPERVSDLCVAMRQHRLEPKRMRYVHAAAHAAASLLLVEARRDAAAGVKILPPLILYARPNEYSDEAKRIFHT